MSAVRTVRFLDREPGDGPSETKTVAGIEISRGIPIPAPSGRGSPVVEALLALEPGESFATSTPAPKYAVKAKAVVATGRKFTVRKLRGGQWRVWRLS